MDQIKCPKCGHGEWVWIRSGRKAGAPRLTAGERVLRALDRFGGKCQQTQITRAVRAPSEPVSSTIETLKWSGKIKVHVHKTRGRARNIIERVEEPEIKIIDVKTGNLVPGPKG